MKKGFILIVAMITMAVLVVALASLVTIVTGGARNIKAQTDDYKMLYLCDAGLELASKAIKDDTGSSSTAGMADLRGSAFSSPCGYVPDPENARAVDGAATTFSDGFGDRDLVIGEMDPNYAGSRLRAMTLHVTGSFTGSRSNPTWLIAEYTTDGISYRTIADNIILPEAESELIFPFPEPLPSWDELLNSSFSLRITRNSDGDEGAYINAVFLRATFETDTLTEAWATGSYQSFPVEFGSDSIASVSIADEQGKIHLNTASGDLIRNLFVACGFGDAAASSAADNIIARRNSSAFLSVEELAAVSGVDADMYDAAHDFFTVYSFINGYVKRPSSPRAAININTAPPEVLKAVFGPPLLGESDASQMASDIISRRSALTFPALYTADPSGAVSTLATFIDSRAYLDATEKASVLDAVDGSAYPLTGADAPTTELCYNSGAFKASSESLVGTRGMTVSAIRNRSAGPTVSRVYGDTPGAGYRKESFE